MPGSAELSSISRSRLAACGHVFIEEARITRKSQPRQRPDFNRYVTLLAMMSDTLDSCGEIISWVESDLTDGSAPSTGRAGLPVESVLRCAILKQVRQLSYKELAFYLEDSGSFRSCARLPQGVVPKKSALQDNISRLKPRPGNVLIRHSLAGHWPMKWSMASKSG